MCRSTATLSPPPQPPCSPREQVRAGTVIAVGHLAATVAETDTQRQFYAALSKWGVLRVGDAVEFRKDSENVAGDHYVGTKKYVRHHCLPLGRYVGSDSFETKQGVA